MSDLKEPVPVRARDCRCAGQHDGQDGRDDGDWVYLAPRLPAPAGIEMMALGREEMTDVEAGAVAVMVWIKHGVRRWNLVQPVMREGQEVGVEPMPLSPSRVREEFADWDDAAPIVHRALELYGGSVAAPLGKRTAGSSRRGPTGASTSRKRRSGTKARAR
jgi:hypothetical protein